MPSVTLEPVIFCKQRDIRSEEVAEYQYCYSSTDIAASFCEASRLEGMDHVAPPFTELKEQTVP